MHTHDIWQACLSKQLLFIIHTLLFPTETVEDSLSIMLQALIFRAYKMLSFEYYYDIPERTTTLQQKDVAMV